MGLLWAWGALVIIIIYSTGILTWSTLWQYFLTFMVVAGLCLFLSKVLQADHDGLDDKMLRISLGLAVTTPFAVVLPEGAIAFSRLGGVHPEQASVSAPDHVFVFVGSHGLCRGRSPQNADKRSTRGGRRRRVNCFT